MAATRSSARQVLWEILASVDDGQDLNGVVVHAIDETIRELDELPDFERGRFRDTSPGVGKGLGLLKASSDPIDGLLGVYRRDETNVLGNRGELIDGVLRPAEPESHDARRMRLRMRAMASSCETSRPSSASARPVATACRT